MKKIIGFIVLCALVIAGYAAAGPFLTIYQIKSAIERQDEEKLARLVDFPALRASLKGQLAALAAKEAAAGSKDSPLASLAAGFSARLAEGLVDSLVTPAGITSLIGGLRPETAPGNRQGPGPSPDAPKPPPGMDPGGARPPEEPTGPQPELFPNARYTYDGLSRFSVWVKEDRCREIRFVLIRGGLSWRLEQIVLPAGF
jgi:hypothetical protein